MPRTGLLLASVLTTLMVVTAGVFAGGPAVLTDGTVLASWDLGSSSVSHSATRDETADDGGGPEARERRVARQQVHQALQAATRTADRAVKAEQRRLAQVAKRRQQARDRRERLKPFDLTIVQANIYAGLDLGRFRQDLAKVSAGRPDFITLNEVNNRDASVMVPPGYDHYRAMNDAFTKETPVLWRTDTWERVDVGTQYLSNRKVKWGIRAVNWARVRHRVSGLEVTIVSAHPAPTRPFTEGLLHQFMSGLGGITRAANDHGPVLVGGDLNAPWGQRWNSIAHLVTAAELRSTVDVYGTPPGGTGDHGAGATLDYVLFSTTGGITPSRTHSTLELHSDHDAVVAHFTVDPSHFVAD